MTLIQSLKASHEATKKLVERENLARVEQVKKEARARLEVEAELAAQKQSMSPPIPLQGQPIEKPRILKRVALVAELQHEWPTIDGDLREASRNGLKDLAHTGTGWDVEKARQWADSKGKPTNSAKAPIWTALQHTQKR